MTKVGNVDPETTAAEDSFFLWRQIFDIARSTPSPHNVQPWRLKLISDDTAELYIDGMRTLPNEDLTGSFVLSAMGMFLEATDLLAAQHGMRIEYEMPQSAEWYAKRISSKENRGLILFARLRMYADPDVSPIYPPSLFLSRRTSRISLRPDPVPESAIVRFSQVSAEWGHRYTHITNPAVIEEILAHNIFAVFQDMNLATYHDEITSWFRFTDRAAETHRDGLDWRCMNLSRAEFWLSARMSKVLLFPPTRAIFKRRYRKQLGNVPSIGVLSGNFFNSGNAVHSGRLLLRFWLEITQQGLHLHPYGNLVTNHDAATWFEQTTGIRNAWLVFKIGFSDTPPASHRRTFDEILIAANDRTVS